MKWMEINGNCPRCKAVVDQAIVHDAFIGCEACWGIFCDREQICIDCGEGPLAVFRGRTQVKCEACLAEDWRDHLDNSRSMGSIY